MTQLQSRPDVTASEEPAPIADAGAVDTARPGLSTRLRSGLGAAVAASGPVSPVAQVLTWVFGLVAILALWLVIFGLFLSGLVYSHAQHNLYAQFRSQLAGGVAPIGGSIAEGAPVALISSSTADLHGVVVVEGSNSRAMRDGPGHTPGTPLPGQAGACLILGRTTSFGGPFAQITSLRRGDVLDVTTGQGIFHYAVQDVRHPGDPLPGPLAAGGSQLTLVSAEGGGWRSGWAPSHAVYVDALLRGKTVAAPAQGSIPSASDGVLAHDTRGLYPLVLWLQLLLVAAIGGVWMRSRLGAPRTWLVVLPVALAALWGASESAWLLLPNLL